MLNTIARWTQFFSSRTLPGHVWFASACRASSEIVVPVPVIERAASASFYELSDATMTLGQRKNAWAVEPLVLAYSRTKSVPKRRLLSDALDGIVGEPWLAWFNEHRESLGAAARQLELPKRHSWDVRR